MHRWFIAILALAILFIAGCKNLNNVEASGDEHNVPHVLVINGQQWTVWKEDHLSDSKTPGAFVYGSSTAETDCFDREIHYIWSQNPVTLRTNLMHEIFHAGACTHGGDVWWNSINPTREEHPGIYHLGEFMTDFVRMNPTFMNWMQNNQ